MFNLMHSLYTTETILEEIKLICKTIKALSQYCQVSSPEPSKNGYNSQNSAIKKRRVRERISLHRSSDLQPGNTSFSHLGFTSHTRALRVDTRLRSVTTLQFNWRVRFWKKMNPLPLFENAKFGARKKFLLRVIEVAEKNLRRVGVDERQWKWITLRLPRIFHAPERTRVETERETRAFEKEIRYELYCSLSSRAIERRNYVPFLRCDKNTLRFFFFFFNWWRGRGGALREGGDGKISKRERKLRKFSNILEKGNQFRIFCREMDLELSNTSV